MSKQIDLTKKCVLMVLQSQKEVFIKPTAGDEIHNFHQQYFSWFLGVNHIFFLYITKYEGTFYLSWHIDDINSQLGLLMIRAVFWHYEAKCQEIFGPHVNKLFQL